MNIISDLRSFGRPAEAAPAPTPSPVDACIFELIANAAKAGAKAITVRVSSSEIVVEDDGAVSATLQRSSATAQASAARCSLLDCERACLSSRRAPTRRTLRSSISA